MPHAACVVFAGCQAFNLPLPKYTHEASVRFAQGPDGPVLCKSILCLLIGGNDMARPLS